LVDRRHADDTEHFLPVVVGEGEIRVLRHCSARTCLYAPASSSESTSLVSDMRMRTSQPFPYGSSFTVSGASTTTWLTSSTSSESGAITSETAFTDSTSPYDRPAARFAPVDGASKCT